MSVETRHPWIGNSPLNSNVANQLLEFTSYGLNYRKIDFLRQSGHFISAASLVARFVTGASIRESFACLDLGGNLTKNFTNWEEYYFELARYP